MYRFYLKGFRLILAFIGVFLGFTSKVLAQYGAPVNIFQININIRSEICHEPIKDIQVKINDPSTGSVYESQADSNGLVRFYGETGWGNNKLYLSFKDIDGPLNLGQFSDTDKTFVFGRHNNTLDVFLPQTDLPHCLLQENPEQTEVPLSEETIEISETEQTLAPHNDNTETAQVSDTEMFLLYPNPSTGEFRLVFKLEEAVTASIRVIDMNSKIIYTETKAFNSGMAEHVLSLSDAADGTYLVQLLFKQTLLSKKLIINH